MKRDLIAASLMLVSGIVALLCLPTVAQEKAGAVSVGECRISGPYTHGNLSVFLIHGADKIKGKTFLTLQEAMEQKKVIVHETGNVNKLVIENVGEVDIYIQSGDIVKGGKQDRTIALDFIAPARSGKMQTDAFCVEQGRWRQRGGEQVAQFASSSEMLATKDLKLAAKADNDQGKVWDKVAEAQGKLSENVGVNVQAGGSASSLQLSLENTKVQQSTDEYVKDLASVTEGKDDVIGYAFAINGKMNSADVYASAGLFRKLWPKLLKASAVEAVAEFQKDRKFDAPVPGAVKACMEDAEQGKTRRKKAVTDRVQMVTSEGAASIMFETRDAEQNDAAVHRNYVAK
jgi:hypothetical protein